MKALRFLAYLAALAFGVIGAVCLMVSLKAMNWATPKLPPIPMPTPMERYFAARRAIREAKCGAMGQHVSGRTPAEAAERIARGDWT